MSNDSFTFNANASGQAQVNQGQTVNATQTNIAGESVSPEKLFAAIKVEIEKLPDAEKATVSQSVKPLEELACGKPADLQRSVQTSTLQKYLDAIRPHAALIGRCLAAFTEASLTTLAASNPIVAGVVAIAKEVRK